ncbi:anthocyanidin 3-O-glucosyltransferase 7-like [Chenopodium quinoa]|uniref:anthocyanidin 3-O-glucosyltransferase 7-like n=1 Tax=Chenopodium quinoa TaxID=63459 RepID=UPI000B77FA78|nr:anthocyanidin 3-O-glucosyltransferase 7-like [Chenopodium quinoa]
MEDRNTNVNAKITHHIAVYAFPFGSHGSPLLNIIRRLAALAPRNKVHFSFFSTPNSINTLFPKGSKFDVDCPNIKAYEVWDGKPVGYVSKGNPLEEIDLFLKAVARPGALKKVLEEAEENVGVKVSCVMGDAFLSYLLCDLALEVKVPWVSCWIPGEHSFCVHVYTDAIRQRFGTQGIEEGREEENLDFLPGLNKIRVKDIPDGIVTGNIDSPISQLLHKMSQVLPYASAICLSSCEELDPIVTNDLKSKLSNVFAVGPLSLVVAPSKVADTYNCLGWLDQQRPNSVVYVSFGSVATPTPNELFALAEALQASGLKFLWSMKDHLKVHFPNGFLESNKENGMIVPWAPQVDVLAHGAVGVFITHFGYHSIIESIAAEVPMIGRPFLGDHKLNGRLVEAVWKIGLKVEGGVFTKNKVVKSLDRILWCDEGKKMKETIKNLNNVVRKAIAPDGSSNKNFKLLLELVMKT